MREFNGFDDLPAFVRPVVTVGSYDGVHAGHRKLLGRIVELARQIGGQSVVITFAPHPRTVLGNRGERIEMLNTLEEKIMLLESLGIDNLIVVPFTDAFSRISSDAFVRDYLVGRVGVAVLVVGFNHHFGHNHQGNFHSLERLQAELGFSIYEIPEQDVEAHKVSSTAIRSLIRTGEMARAAHLLGAPYFVTVRDGRPQEEEKLLPPPGNYPVTVQGSGARAMLHIGTDRKLTVQPPGTVGNLRAIRLEFC